MHQLPALSERVLFVLLLLLVSALYWPGLSGPFIFDDGPALTGNPYLRFDGTEFDDWRTATFSSNSGPFRRPVAMASFAANRVLSGEVSAFPIKFVNLIIHLLSGMLVYLLAIPLLRRGLPRGASESVAPIALFASALWMLAPLHVSTVLYAVQRMAQLATLFALAGLVLFAYRRERWAISGGTVGDVLSTSLWLLLLLFLAVLSKENGLLLLWLLAVMEVALYRGQWAGRKVNWLKWLGWAALALPLIAVGLGLIIAPESILGGYSRRDFTLEERMLTQLRLLWQYLGWMVYPDINAMGFQHDDIPLSRSWFEPVSTFIAAAAWCSAIVISVLARKKLPLLVFALLFYLFGHSMESGLWPLEMVYEHRSYLPSVGVFIFLSFAVFAVLKKLPRIGPSVPVLALVAVSSTLLFLRVHVWAEPMRLSAINVRNHPESSRSHFFYAESLLLAHSEAREAGAGNEELGQYLLLSRHHVELMYKQNPRDMAAIVLLYYLDSQYFPDLEIENDWFFILRELARSRPLQASDYSSLNALIDCFIAEICDAPEEELFGLLDTLEGRYPGNTKLLLLRYRYLKETEAPLSQRLEVLERAQSIQPSNTRIYQYQINEFAAEGDLSGSYEAVRQWMRSDLKRRDLGLIQRLFEAEKGSRAPYEQGSTGPGETR